MPRVKYLRNADPRAGTAGITLSHDRETIPIGGEGVLTDEEYLKLSQTLSLEVLDEAEQPDLSDDDPSIDDLEDKNQQELREIAEEEEVDLSGAKRNEEIKAAIRNKRNPQPEGAASLPATASAPANAPIIVSSPEDVEGIEAPTPVVSGAGGAAGPGGAASAGAGTSGTTTGSEGVRP